MAKKSKNRETNSLPLIFFKEKERKTEEVIVVAIVIIENIFMVAILYLSQVEVKQKKFEILKYFLK